MSQSSPISATNGEEASQSTPPTPTIWYPGLHCNPEPQPDVATGIEVAEHQQLPSPGSQNNNARWGSICSDSSNQNINAVDRNRRDSILQDINSQITGPRPIIRRATDQSILSQDPQSIFSRTTLHDKISQEPPNHEKHSQDRDIPSGDDRPVELGVPEAANLPNSLWNRTRYLHWANLRQKYRCLLPILTLCLLVVCITLVVLYTKSKKSDPRAITLTESILPQSSILPITDSSLGAAIAVLGSYFDITLSGDPDTKLVYNGGGGKLCVRTKSGSSWLNNVQCVEGADPKPNTPIAVLDWLGGPSIYYITTSNTLSGIDNVPQNDTWKLSSLAAEKMPTHPQSQLAAVTWLNGTSSWVYYEDGNSQLREYGIDDYRDETWRGGSTGPLGLTQDGSAIGISRYLIDGAEVMEVFVQTVNDAIHGRLYINNVWDANFYAVDGTTTSLIQDAALTATTVNQTNGSMVLLAWVSSTGFLTVQSRATVNVTQYVYSCSSTLLPQWRFL